MSWWRWHENPPGRRDIFLGDMLSGLWATVFYKLQRTCLVSLHWLGEGHPYKFKLYWKRAQLLNERPLQRDSFAIHRDSALLHFRVLIIIIFPWNNFSYHFLKILPQLDLSIFRHFGACWWASQVLMGGLSYGHMLTHLDLSSTSQIIFFWGVLKTRRGWLDDWLGIMSISLMDSFMFGWKKHDFWVSDLSKS